jgi:hypothetical protein
MGMFQMLLISWGAITALLVIMLIYRSMLENREEDHLVLDAAGDSMARENRAIVTRIEKLNMPIMALMVLSAVLLLSMAGMWLYQGYQHF